MLPSGADVSQTAHSSPPEQLTPGLCCRFDFAFVQRQTRPPLSDLNSCSPHLSTHSETYTAVSSTINTSSRQYHPEPLRQQHSACIMYQHVYTFLLQLCLAALAFAAPVAQEISTGSINNSWQYGTGGGIIGFIVLVLDIIVFIEVLKSNRPPIHKLLWCLGVFVFPIVGLIVYFFFSNRAHHNSGGSYEPLP
ncbi:hypothetical protein FJTKL_13671 [Diaporthe vaccinii]|uniref:Cardiolipin synthase N-terminal domain-containing protein n=1 Tax=Diaporthe vaccinii TaxID=105482 RepID=A0ABR4E9H5_9PEZI